MKIYISYVADVIYNYNARELCGEKHYRHLGGKTREGMHRSLTKTHKIRREEGNIKTTTAVLLPRFLLVLLSTPWNRRSIQMSGRRSLTE